MRAVRSTPPGVAVVDVDEPDGPGELISISVGEHLRVGLQVHPVRQHVHPRPRARRGDRGRPRGRDRGDLRLRRVRTVPRGPLQPLRHDRHDGARDDGRRRDERVVPRPGPVARRPCRPGSSSTDACLVEPTAVAWHACRLAGVGPETRVGVVGGGAIGLMAVAAAAAMGAAEVSLEARYPHQIELGERLGATAAVGPLRRRDRGGGVRERAAPLRRAGARPAGRWVCSACSARTPTWPHAAVLHEGAADGARARLLPARARARLRGRGRPPRVEPGSRRRADHAPISDRGRGRGVPRRGRQVDRRAAGRARADVLGAEEANRGIPDSPERPMVKRPCGSSSWSRRGR